MERESSIVARDFFGINSNCSGAVKEEEIKERDLCNFMTKEEIVKNHDFKCSFNDSALMASSGMQWPFANKVSALQQFMSFKTAQGERSKMVAEQLASSGFQPISTANAFDFNMKQAAVPQGSFSFETRQSSQNGMPSYPPQSHDQGVSAHHHPIPVAMGNSFFKIHGSVNGSCGIPTSTKPLGGIPVSNPHSVIPAMGSLTGAFAPRNMAPIPAKPVSATAQLTIFYAGAVNVYDDVPVEKAQAIMFLAGTGATGNGPNLTATTTPTKPAADAVHGNHATSPCSGLSSPISATSHSAVQSGAGSSSPEELMMAIKTAGALASSNQEPPKISAVESAAALLPRAVPQARKASLARFLEKRKERVANANVAPYAGKKSPEHSAANGIS